MENKENASKQAIEHLQEHHIRITPQRLAIVNYMIHSTGHPRVEDIYDDLTNDFPNMSLATVYNTLKVLKENNIVKEIHTDNPSTRYDYNGREHYHIICKSCGKIVDVDFPLKSTFGKKFEESTGFIIDSYDLKLQGLCSECQLKYQEQEKD